jgi:hypothetical protein
MCPPVVCKIKCVVHSVFENSFFGQKIK